MIVSLFLVVFGTMTIEAICAAGNEHAQRLRGGIEPADDVYRMMRVVYPGVFLLMFAEAGLRGSAPAPVVATGVLMFTGAKALKWWAIEVLGVAWTFRVIVVPDAPLVTRGPYRWLRHPNYVGVLGELIGTGLMLGVPVTGPLAVVAFSGLLLRRIAVENRMLAHAAQSATGTSKRSSGHANSSAPDA